MLQVPQLQLDVDLGAVLARAGLHDLYEEYVRYVRKVVGRKLLDWPETRMATPMTESRELSSRAS